MPEITGKSWIMVAALGLIWGGTFLVMEIALRGITPFWLASARIGFATLLMLAIWAFRGFRLFTQPVGNADILRLIAIGALSSAVPFMLLSWGQQYVTSGFAGVSMAAVALVVLPLAHFLVPGEWLTRRKVAGFVIGFMGVVVLIGGQAFETTGESLEGFGRIACLGAASCYALSSVQMRLLPDVDSIGLNAVTLLIGAVIVIAAAWAVEGSPPKTDRNTLYVLLFLGLVPTAGASLLRVLVIRTAGPVFMSLVNYQVPVWSVVLGALILSEPLPPSLISALALILCGVGVSQYGALSRLFRRV
ncbi:Permease of the drug/metabolite transporter (DMT) superfamily [Roseovarius pacificus]|uniref:Permease of the drug/metabolite transporter (DMT) superfamily n=1 Tax=Roseovarius pacificus TaxID=337701 RepID=A0A1M6Y2P6_9RHOB|nr:DMT family transporter [Roseovarius pacificus]GGO51439.1 membrane protein [Roseovarius pacificus]SHL12434.1 Permease of the drug/metabolite transporter (DMT) superfamily [Roseovarius pacificus]